MAGKALVLPCIIRQAETSLLFCAGIKNLQAGQGQEGKPRHRFALSDGELWLTGVPATQIEHLVQDGILFTNVILRLNEYLVNAVNNKK